MIPLPDAYADVVTAAQAFHWFDHAVALPEIARVLRPGGRLALVWNTRDDTEPWVARLERADRKRGDRCEDVDEPIDESGLFGPVETATFRFEQRLDRETLLDLVLSRSYCAKLPPAEREPILEAVGALYDEQSRPRASPPPVRHRVLPRDRSRLESRKRERADDRAAAGVAHDLEARSEEHRQVARCTRRCSCALRAPDSPRGSASVVARSPLHRGVEERRGDALPLRRRMDVEADDRPHVLVVDARELRRVLEPLEGRPRADPAPSDGHAVDVGEEAGLGAAADLRLEPRAVASAVTVPVRVPAEVPELAPAAVRLRCTTARARPLEEIATSCQRSGVAV